MRNLSPDPVSNYSVKLMQGNTELASTLGTPLNSMETGEFTLSWTPTQTGTTTLQGKVVMPGDENPINDTTPPYPVDVMPEGLFILQIGDGTAVNTDTGRPVPYGTWYKNFRQQYLIRSSELYALGAAPGLINAIAFDVQNLNTCGPMPNYRIRLKHTNQEALITTFETGVYTQVYHSPSFMPEVGWNMHAFSEPFFWDGASNLIVELVTDIAPSVGRNVSSPYHTTGYISSVRYQSDSIAADGYATGTTSTSRNNMRFYMDIGEIGSLAGTVTSDGAPLADATITVEGTVWETTTAANGNYSIPVLLAGEYQVTASKIGYETLSFPVTISEGEQSVLNFNMQASSGVSVSGTIVGSDNPAAGLDNATIALTGVLPYTATTNAQGEFTMDVLSGNSYGYMITRDGYQFQSGTIEVGSIDYDMGTITLDELTLPPGVVIAEISADETAIDLTWSPPGGSGGGLFFDFENDDGGWVASDDSGGVGDWEWTDNYNVSNFVITDPDWASYTIPPPSAYSGTGMWGTKINSNHSNSGGYHYLTKTFNFSGLTDATLRFMSFENVYGDWDYCQITVNGNLVWGPSWEDINTHWLERIVDLSAYDGLPEVTIRLEMFATTVRAYAGWYIDDFEIGTASEFAPPTVSNPTLPIRYAGMLETDHVERPQHDTRTALQPQVSPRLNSRPNDHRIPVGYKAWRLLLGEEASENLWTELTTDAITDTTFTDTAWQNLPNGVYKWAVKTVYTNNVISDARFSNAVRLEPNDLSALEITGSTTPSVNSPSIYTVRIKNTGTTSQTAGSYFVKIMSGTNQLAIAPGPALGINEVFEMPISWTPTSTGVYQIYGLVSLPGDTNPANDQTSTLGVTVMGEGLMVLQFGTGTITNTETGVPTPYGTYYKSFRQQYLYRADEIYALGGAPGLISAIAFDVQSVGQCSPMPNYRIRIKETTQTALSTIFETGEYTQVFHEDDFLPTDGWNIHAFDVPFMWNGVNNIIIDIVTDVFQLTYTRNALVPYTTTNFTSSVRNQSDSIPQDTATSGTTSSNRSNTRFFLMVEDMGSLTGTVTEGGVPVPNVLVSVENTIFNTLTNQNGVYNMPHVPVGTHTVTAGRNGYADVSHTVVIEDGEQTVQDFAMIGTPDFTIVEETWHFGDVTIGSSASKTIHIANAGGGELVIQSITHSGSGAFTLVQPTLPVTLRTDQTLDLPITFAPAVLGMLSATFTITDNQNNRYLITSSNSPAQGRATNATLSRDAHELVVSGNGVHNITIGTGAESARMPYDFYWKNSLFQTILTQDDLGDFTGFITGIKLYSDFLTEVMATPVKIWLGGTTLNNLSAGWISSNQMTLVFDGMVNFPGGTNTIAINFPDPFLFVDGENLLMLFQRPMDANYYSSSNFFRCQTLGSNRSRNNYSDSVAFDPANMTDGTLSGQFPMMTLEVIPGGVGHIEGIVRGEDGSPLSGVQVNVDTRTSATTNQFGEFHIFNLLPNNYQVSFSRYGYLSQTENIVIEEDQTVEMDITMQEMPQVSILGTIVASDTGDGIEGAQLVFSGYANYTANSNADGEFLVDSNVYAYNTYEYVLTATGYSTQSGSIEVGPEDYDMGTITMEELAFAPTQVAAAIAPDYSSVNISWNPPDPDAFEIVESFEGVSFPPTDWSQTITNNGPPNMHGVRPTWCKFGTAEGVSPTDGGQQAGLAWVAEHQDEWLFTPSFTCPPDAYLRFDTYLEMGSDGGDHYYVKASNNGGASWQVLWDGSAQPDEFNNYDTPIVVDLIQFGGQMIKLAWHADDGTSALGMYHNWYIDNVYIGNFVRGDELSLQGASPAPLSLAQSATTTRGVSIDETNIQLSRKDPKHHSRALTGYKVWRLRSGQEEAENNWVLLTDEMLTETGLVDDGWQELAEGQYVWAVKAIYTANVESMPVFSNTLFKENTNGTISGFVRRSGNNQAIAGATVSAGDNSSTTTASGFYSISLPAGTYSVTASHADYHSLTQDDVIVVPNENTTLNFTMISTSTEDVVEIAVTALSANYPNPFNPETTISYDLKESAQVRLDVFNLKGQLIKTLVNDKQASGRYNVVFTANDDKGNKLSSGIYFYRLKAGDYTKTRKMMLME